MCLICCRCCNSCARKLCLFTIGFLLLTAGIVLTIIWPGLSSTIINADLQLTPTSRSFKTWLVTPIPVYRSFYLYNWTNPHEVNSTDTKPHFQEMGPYAFQEVQVKEDLEWHNANSTVTFSGRRTWYFDPKHSKGSLDDLITVPHFPSVASAHFSRRMRKFVKKIINFTLNREGGGLTLTHTASEWIFEGFYLDMYDFGQRLHSPLVPINTNKFAWFYNYNNSKEADGTFTVNTGQSDISQLGDLKLWNGKAHSGYWEGECGRINGSTGELWSPKKRWDESISLFTADAGRYLNLFPQRNVSFHGVEGWLYTSTNQTFDSGYVAPDTKCFCVPNRECPGNGVIDISPIVNDAPFYMSHAHFHMADARYLENITGLNPNPEKHGMYVLMEPTLGIPLKIEVQAQTSLLVEQNDDIDIFRNVSHNFYAPLFAVQYKAEISEEHLNLVKLVRMVPLIGVYIGIGLIVVGLILIAVGVWQIYAKKAASKSSQ